MEVNFNNLHKLNLKNILLLLRVSFSSFCPEQVGIILHGVALSFRCLLSDLAHVIRFFVEYETLAVDEVVGRERN